MYSLEGNNGPFWMKLNYTKGFMTIWIWYHKTAIPQRQSCGSLWAAEHFSNCSISVAVKECEVKEGWLGKPKGMLQMFWEHGWIDSTKVESCHTKVESCQCWKHSLLKKRRFWWGREIKGWESTVCSFLPFELMQGLQRGDVWLGIPRGTWRAQCNNLHPFYTKVIKYCWGAAKQIFRKLPLKK
jgi:hypothetical protein